MPVDASVNLVKATDDDECVEQQLYRSAVGSLYSILINCHETRYYI